METEASQTISRGSREPKAFVMTPRAQKIYDQAPKTPEELLTLIKDFLDKPDMNGYEFVENISGIDREHWGKKKRYETTKGIIFQTFPILCPKCPYQQQSSKKKNFRLLI